MRRKGEEGKEQMEDEKKDKTIKKKTKNMKADGGKLKQKEKKEGI